jgi:hypothetical protein
MLMIYPWNITSQGSNLKYLKKESFYCWVKKKLYNRVIHFVQHSQVINELEVAKYATPAYWLLWAEDNWAEAHIISVFDYHPCIWLNAGYKFVMVFPSLSLWKDRS